jgi:hypothetical protein
MSNNTFLKWLRNALSRWPVDEINEKLIASWRSTNRGEIDSELACCYVESASKELRTIRLGVACRDISRQMLKRLEFATWNQTKVRNSPAFPQDLSFHFRVEIWFSNFVPCLSLQTTNWVKAISIWEPIRLDFSLAVLSNCNDPVWKQVHGASPIHHDKWNFQRIIRDPHMICTGKLSNMI